jgi:hypothetical protein
MPMHCQIKEPPRSVTAVGVPAEQKLVVGALGVVWPFADPQTPLIVVPEELPLELEPPLELEAITPELDAAPELLEFVIPLLEPDELLLATVPELEPELLNEPLPELELPDELAITPLLDELPPDELEPEPELLPVRGSALTSVQPLLPHDHQTLALFSS